MQVEDIVYAIWLPLAIMLVFGVVGFIRGAAREIVVAAAVALGAFIVSQWAGQWAAGLYGVYTGVAQEQQQFILSLVVLWLIVLVIGYGVGGYLPRERPTVQSRMAGGLLGLATGAALAGWSMRYSITNIEGTLYQGYLLDNEVSRGFMIWANWFPIMLALLGTLLALLGPVRRAQRRAAQPSEASDWAPTAPPQRPAPEPLPSRTASSLAPTAPYGVIPTPAAQPNDRERSVARTATGPVEDAPPTQLLPVSETERRPASDAARAGSRETRQFDSAELSAARNSSDVTFAPGSTGPAPASEPSWLIQSARDNEQRPAQDWTTLMEGGVGAKETRPHVTESSNRPDEGGAPAPGAGTPESKKCPNCGAQAMPGALFCTECGTRL